jgi:hypothetical protein
MASPPPELPLVGLSSPSEVSSASRSARLGSRRSPHVLALAGLDSGVFLDAGPPHGRKLMRDPLLKFDSPSECYRGAPPDSALAVFPQALAVRTGTRLSWGSAPLRRLRYGCHRAATTGANADRVRRGLPDPHRCRPRAFSAPRRFWLRHPADPGCPELLRTTLAPKLRGLLSCRDVPGVRPAELSPPGEPYRLVGGRCFPAGSTSIVSRRGDACSS